MTIAYILSQILTIIMYTLLAFSYLEKDRKKLVLISTSATIINAVVYTLLNAWTGLAMCFVAFFRNLYSISSEKKYPKSTKITRRDVIVLIVTFLAIIAVSIPTYDGFWSLMSVFGTMAYTYSIWQKKPIVYKFFGIPVGFLWIAYNYYVGSFFGVVLEVALLAASIYGYIVALKASKTKNNPHRRKAAVRH